MVYRGLEAAVSRDASILFRQSSKRRSGRTSVYADAHRYSNETKPLAKAGRKASVLGCGMMEHTFTPSTKEEYSSERGL